MSKTRELYPLSNRKVIKKTLRGVIGHFIFWFSMSAMIVLPMIFGIYQKTNPEHYYSAGFKVFGIFTVFLILFFVLLSTFIYLYQKWYFNVYYYDLTEQGVIIKKGPITPKEVTIPYENIQDVGVDQDLFDRFFGLYDVHISSANFVSGLEAHIDGVLKDGAEGLKNAILAKVKIAKLNNKAL